MNKEVSFKTNRFLALAEEYRIYATADEDIAKIDMTEEFWKEMDIEIRDDELINLNVNAKVRLGKSTVAMAIGKKIYELLLKHKRRDFGEFNINNIARDQQEYSKMMRDPNTRNTVIVIDEINDLENTGENSSVERALADVFNNVQAGRYVHKISCSPFEISDVNADVFLEIVSTDRRRKITTAYLYYNLFKGGQSYRQLLGHVNFYVGDIIERWDKKIKDLFFKEGKTEKDIKTIERARKKDFYVDYQVRKYEKMELITNEGILRPRMLEYAEIILNVEEELRSLAKMNILTRDTVKNYIKSECKAKGIPTSIIGEELMTGEVLGILSLWKNMEKIDKQIKKHMKDQESDDYDSYKEEVLKDTYKNLHKVIHAQLEELRKYKEINLRYHAKPSL